MMVSVLPIDGDDGLWADTAVVKVVPSSDTRTSICPGASYMSLVPGFRVSLLTFITCFMSTVKYRGNLLMSAVDCWYCPVDQRVPSMPSKARAVSMSAVSCDICAGQVPVQV